MEQIDLVEANLKTIQSMIATEQSNIIKSGALKKGPAYYKACENVGKALNPPTGAPELASWVGRYSASNARDGRGKRDFAEGNDGSHKAFKAVIADDEWQWDEVEKPQSRYEHIKQQLRIVDVGEKIKLGPFASEEETRLAQTQMGRLADSAGWKRNGKSPIETHIKPESPLYMYVKRIS